MSSTDLLFDLTPTEEQQMSPGGCPAFCPGRDGCRGAGRRRNRRPAGGFLHKTVDLGLNFYASAGGAGRGGAGRSPVSNVLTIEDLACGDMSMAIAALAPCPSSTVSWTTVRTGKGNRQPGSRDSGVHPGRNGPDGARYRF